MTLKRKTVYMIYFLDQSNKDIVLPRKNSKVSVCHFFQKLKLLRGGTNISFILTLLLMFGLENGQSC